MILLHLSAYITSPTFVKNFPEDGQCMSKHAGVPCAYNLESVYCFVIVGIDVVTQILAEIDPKIRLYARPSLESVE